MSFFWKNLFYAILAINCCFVSGRNVTSITTSDILSNIVIPFPSENWILSSGDGFLQNITAYVPGDLLTDLMSNQIIDDPYIDRNFLTQRNVWSGESWRHKYEDHIHSTNDYDNRKRSVGNYIKRKRTWIYSTMFELPSHNSKEMSWKLVLEGIKMGAEIFIDSNIVGQVTDQFLRYEFDIDDVLDKAKGVRRHNLTISFDPSIHVNGRFSACSGGWDWSPYTKVVDDQKTGMFTLGIIKPVYIIGIGKQHFYISHVVPKIYYLGKYPRKPLSSAEGDFRLDVDVHIRFSKGKNRTLLSNSSIYLITDFAGKIESNIPDPSTLAYDELASIVSINITVPKESIELWWPNGMGKQTLYNIYIGANSIPNTYIKKRIGFRTSALVTTNESSNVAFAESHPESAEGSGQFGMYFRVNGAIVFARGANFIPMDQLEGRLSSKAHRIVVNSASKANMNMIRIWGGGMIPPKSFYDACDEEGILVYHDMMFVDENGHGPVKTKTISDEIRHLVRSLASHPSLLVWNGCNECEVVMDTPSEIYAAFVMKTVAEEDDTRPIWPSSPSRHGWKTGVRRIDSRPLAHGSNLTTWGPNSFPSDLESHGPYMRSFSYSYPGVNGLDVHFPYKNTPPTLKRVEIGVDHPNQFASEFGSSIMSSFESMTETITPAHWSLHGNNDPDICIHDYGNNNQCNGTNIMAERNYPCDSHIRAYFGIPEDDLSAVGIEAFSKQLYMCLMAQTLWMKGEIESRRSKNYLGLLVWQLNEVWPTGGWGLLEYGRKSKDGSQIFGGRWKPLMHLLKSSLFVDQIVACGKGDLCYVRNDHFETVKVTLTFEAWDLQYSTKLGKHEFTNELSGGSIHWFELPSNFTLDSQVILVQLKAFENSLLLPKYKITQSVYLKDTPKSIRGLENPVHIEILDIYRTKDAGAAIVLRSNKLALFLVLTTRAEGAFSDNCFFLRPFEKKIVAFHPMDNEEAVDLDILRASLRVEHLGLYMESSDGLADE